MIPEEGRRRVVIEGVEPLIDAGRFPIKRIVGDIVTVEADVFADGHDELAVRLLWRSDEEVDWMVEPMLLIGNDRWRGSFPVERLGRYRYSIEGWVDRFGSWVRDMARRVEARQDVAVDLLIGADLVDDAATRAAAYPGTGTAAADAELLRTTAARLRDSTSPVVARTRAALHPAFVEVVERYPDRALATRLDIEPGVVVDRERARFSSWYELFPRSAAPKAGRHGTLRDVIEWLPYVSGMGFDVLYLPPISPIGVAFRKGPDNALRGGPDDPGVPWAIGSAEGGHTAIHPDLGTMDDFRALVAAAGEQGMELALDIAFQASPDHPWVKEHPEWFRRRPDGSIQYAENPPKKYQDIYPFDFENEAWPLMWEALCGVMSFWAGEGVRVFRVDNPHTKAFPFWEWAIDRLKSEYPDLILLAEAFTRPKVMYRLAKVGFSQSYTYFTWRTTRQELTEYLTELTQTPVREVFRPNLWPNTPDILHETLQVGGRPMFEARLVLAATLSASYGIYGPAFELTEAVPREAGSEEYLHSEKYQLRHWDVERADSLRGMITILNEIRRDHPALQSNESLRFHPVTDDHLIAYSKRTADGADTVLTVVNLDARTTRSGMVELPLREWGIDPGTPFEVDDLLAGVTYLWEGHTNYVELRPGRAQAHVFAVRPLRRETQFETYR